MSTARYFGLTCLVFLALGPLVPIPSLAIHAAVTAGDLSKLHGMFIFSGMSYLLGGLTALKFGLAFAGLVWLLARFLPTLVPRANAYLRACFGMALGTVVGCGFIAPAFVQRLSEMRMHRPFSDSLSLSLLVWWRSDALTSFMFFVLPSLLCGAVAAVWLLPKLLANPSFKRAPNGAA